MAETPKTNAKTSSKTVTDTIVGEHCHTIVGYSLIKGIGDGEPIASERFTVGGHEWVLLFYPDGKRSSSTEGHLGNGTGAADNAAAALVMAGGPMALAAGAVGAAGAAAGHGHHHGDGAADAGAAAAGAGGGQPHAAGAGLHGGQQQQQQQQLAARHHQPPPPPPPPRRDTTNEYAALFVALIGEGPNPQGVVNTSEGKVVRAFHRFTLVDQTGQGRDLTKGRTRDAGAVKISCARQDPNARNCHGYRKFVKRSLLEDPARGFLLNDTLVIRYTIELVVSSGGALSRPGGASTSKADLVKVPAPNLGLNLGELLASGSGADITFVVEDHSATGAGASGSGSGRADGAAAAAAGGAGNGGGGGSAGAGSGGSPAEGSDSGGGNGSSGGGSGGGAAASAAAGAGGAAASPEVEEFRAHKMILEARSHVFRAMLNAPMRESAERRVFITTIKPQVFRVLLHFVYTDALPEELEGASLDVAMAQHLLVAADQYELVRLRRICERRLCETVDTETVATTLALAEQNHAEELKRVCLDYVSRNLASVMGTEGYRHMTRSCPQLQAEILATIATSGGGGGAGGAAGGDRHGNGGGNGGAGHRGGHGTVRPREVVPAAAALASAAAAAAAAAAAQGDDEARRVRQRRE